MSAKKTETSKKKPAAKKSATKKPVTKKTVKKAAVTKTDSEKKAVVTEKPKTKDVSVKGSGKQKFIYDGAPKLCFGRKYDSRDGGPCEGQPGKTPACKFKDECTELVSARLSAGIMGIDDYRIPADFVTPEVKAKAPAPAKKAAKTPKPADNAVATVKDANLTSPAATSITNDELAVVEKHIKELERQQLAGTLAYYLELGREWAFVYKRMEQTEFFGWIARHDKSRQTVQRTMKLAIALDAYSDDVKQLILDAPKITLQKFETLLDVAGPEKLIPALSATAPDSRGADVTMTQLPHKAMMAALKTHVNQASAKDNIDDLVKAAERRDAAKLSANTSPVPTATASDGTPLEAELLTDDDAPQATVTSAEVQPFFAMPHLLELNAVKRSWMKTREKIANGNVATLTAADIKVLAAHAEFLEGTLLPDIIAILDMMEA